MQRRNSPPLFGVALWQKYVNKFKTRQLPPRFPPKERIVLSGALYLCCHFTWHNWTRDCQEIVPKDIWFRSRNYSRTKVTFRRSRLRRLRRICTASQACPTSSSTSTMTSCSAETCGQMTSTRTPTAKRFAILLVWDKLHCELSVLDIVRSDYNHEVFS